MAGGWTGQAGPVRVGVQTRRRCAVPTDTVPLLVSGCDALYNTLFIQEDLFEVGMGAFACFKAGLEGTLWYYGELAKIFSERACPVGPALSAVVDGLHQLAS